MALHTAQPGLWLTLGYSLGFYNAIVFLAFSQLPGPFWWFLFGFFSSVILLITIGINALFLRIVSLVSLFESPLEFLHHRVGRIAIAVFGFAFGVIGAILPSLAFTIRLDSLSSILLPIATIILSLPFANFAMLLILTVLFGRAYRFESVSTKNPEDEAA